MGEKEYNDGNSVGKNKKKKIEGVNVLGKEQRTSSESRCDVVKVDMTVNYVQLGSNSTDRIATGIRRHHKNMKRGNKFKMEREVKQNFK